jgi:hypothetical protein
VWFIIFFSFAYLLVFEGGKEFSLVCFVLICEWIWIHISWFFYFFYLSLKIQGCSAMALLYDISMSTGMYGKVIKLGDDYVKVFFLL